MPQYISKSALEAEIKRIEHETNYEPFTDEVLGKKYVCKSLLSFLDVLEVKEVDLEKALDDYIYTHDGRKKLALELDWKCCNLTLKGGDEIIEFAKHFFELGLKAQKI